MAFDTTALLLDSAPNTWTSQEDRHAALCQELRRIDVRPLLVFSEELAPEISARLKASGAELACISYGTGVSNYRRELKNLLRSFSVGTAHIIFFDYFSAVPWIVRSLKVPHIIYEMQNSGEFNATSVKGALLRLRNQLASAPMERVIAISDFVKRQLVKGGIAEGKITVRYLGVDTERFTPDPTARQIWADRFSIRPEEIIISTVSYLRPFKHPHVLVQACKELALRDVPVRLFVAGDGEMLSDLKSLTAKLNLTDRIHWLGNVQDPRSLLQASDIFVLASVGEAFGLVLAEAMACGVPIVGSRSGSLPEVVAEGKTGLLATPLNPSDFATAIEKLARDNSLRRRMAEESRERVCSRFTVEKAVAETIDIYQDLWVN